MLLGIGPDGPIPGRRVAVTGVGVVACCGNDVPSFWEGLIHPIPQEPGQRMVRDFDPSRYFGPKEARRIDRFAQLSVAAADEALQGAGDLQADPERSGVVFGTGVGGLKTLSEQTIVNHERGPDRVSPFLVPMMMVNAAAANISMRNGWRGPSEAVCTACAAGTHAISAAARLVASGRCDVAIGGGSEASADIGVAIAAFSNMTALSTSGQSRPFDLRRDGFVMSEGAGALVLESWDRAVERGARIYAEIGGAASTSDAHHITAPLPDGAGAVSCMELALFDAGLQPSDVRHVNAHGTSTPLNDLAESRALNKVFGSAVPPVTSTKGVTGHGLGGAGAIEAVAAVLTIEHRLIPPTAGHEELDPEIDLDVVAGAARAWEPGPVLSNSFGFGGHNGCLVILPPTG
ncbi:MAG TPA: beta-ketoacyl-ACP synthase II [Acidimicrobiales bacterium]|nr:beta-ketoacyl-ACP synthase II [Acidimicrobiales bacterium]